MHSNYYITWRAIIYREIFLSRSTILARPKGGRIPRSRTEYFPTLPDLINLLYTCTFCIAIGTGNNERAIWENFALYLTNRRALDNNLTQDIFRAFLLYVYKTLRLQHKGYIICCPLLMHSFATQKKIAMKLGLVNYEQLKSLYRASLIHWLSFTHYLHPQSKLQLPLFLV